MTAARLLVNAAWPGPVPADDSVADLVSGAGADGIGFPDSPRLFADPFVASDRALAATSGTLAGPCVLGLGLRHPATVGCGLRTLVDRHGDRVFAVLARGESAVRNENLRPPSLEAYCAALDATVDALGPASSAMTLLGAASGPRTITATVARLGGVLIDVGIDPDVVAHAVATAREAAPDARCWLFVRAAVVDTEDEARAAAATLLGSCAARIAASPQWYRVPDELRAELAGVAAAHDYRTHGRAGPGAQTPAHGFVRERFFLLGDRTVVADRVRELVRCGVDGIVLAGATGGLVPRLGATVAALRTGLQEGTR